MLNRGLPDWLIQAGIPAANMTRSNANGIPRFFHLNFFNKENVRKDALPLVHQLFKENFDLLMQI